MCACIYTWHVCGCQRMTWVLVLRCLSVYVFCFVLFVFILFCFCRLGLNSVPAWLGTHFVVKLALIFHLLSDQIQFTMPHPKIFNPSCLVHDRLILKINEDLLFYTFIKKKCRLIDELKKNFLVKTPCILVFL